MPNMRGVGCGVALAAVNLLGDIWSPTLMGWMADTFGQKDAMATGFGRALAALGHVPVARPGLDPQNLTAAMLVVVPALLIAGNRPAGRLAPFAARDGACARQAAGNPQPPARNREIATRRLDRPRAEHGIVWPSVFGTGVGLPRSTLRLNRSALLLRRLFHDPFGNNCLVISTSLRDSGRIDSSSELRVLRKDSSDPVCRDVLTTNLEDLRWPVRHLDSEHAIPPRDHLPRIAHAAGVRDRARPGRRGLGRPGRLAGPRRDPGSPSAVFRSYGHGRADRRAGSRRFRVGDCARPDRGGARRVLPVIQPGRRRPILEPPGQKRPACPGRYASAGRLDGQLDFAWQTAWF